MSLAGALSIGKYHISEVFEGGVNFGGLQLGNRLSYRPLVGLIGSGIENTFSMRCFAILNIYYISLSGASNNQKCHIVIHSMVFEGGFNFGDLQLGNRLSFIGFIGSGVENTFFMRCLAISKIVMPALVVP